MSQNDVPLDLPTVSHVEEARLKAEIDALQAEVTTLRSERSAFLVAVAQFTKLDEGLQAGLVEAEAERQSLEKARQVSDRQHQALEIGRTVMTDPDLKYLVANMVHPALRSKVVELVRAHQQSKGIK